MLKCGGVGGDMATLKLNPYKLQHNYRLLKDMFEKNNLDWAIVTKLLSGNELFLEEVLKLNPKQVCDSRISNLKKIKTLNPSIETIYIKPVPMGSVYSLLEVADISFNSELKTLQALSDISLRRGKKHKVIIAVELGDLREGIMGEHILDFFWEVFGMKGIEVVGLGANLNCLNGVMPSEGKLNELSDYRDLVERKFGRKIPLISGGSSVTIPLVEKGMVPDKINHFRVGESLFFGADLFNEGTLPEFYSDVFEVEAEILELSLKPMTPSGDLSKNVHGDVFEIDDSHEGKMRYQGLIDIGSLDIASKYLQPEDSNIQVVGSSSDMTVLDFPPDSAGHQVGSSVKFKASYMVVLGLMNSQYVTKSLVGSTCKDVMEVEAIFGSLLKRQPKRA